MAIVNLTPTFLLRGIEPQKTLNEYSQGKFKIWMPSSKVDKKVSLVIQGTSRHDNIYTFKDRTGSIQVVVTTNQKNYSYYRKHGKLPEGGLCYHCNKKFTGSIFGIPIKLDKDKFYIDNTFCSLRCAHLELEQEMAKGGRERDPIYYDSDVLLRHLHRLISNGKYPDGQVNLSKVKLVPVKVQYLRYTLGKLTNKIDKRLLSEYGGPLDNNEISRYMYARTSNLILAC